MIELGNGCTLTIDIYIYILLLHDLLVVYDCHGNNLVVMNWCMLGCEVLFDLLERLVV